MYTYKVVEGETAMLDLLRRMKLIAQDGFPKFVESFAHIGEVTIERNIYAKYIDDEDGFHEFIILSMPSERGTEHCQSDIRRKVYEQIRTSKRPR